MTPEQRQRLVIIQGNMKQLEQMTGKPVDAYLIKVVVGDIGWLLKMLNKKVGAAPSGGASQDSELFKVMSELKKNQKVVAALRNETGSLQHDKEKAENLLSEVASLLGVETHADIVVAIKEQVSSESFNEEPEWIDDSVFDEEEEEEDVGKKDNY